MLKVDRQKPTTDPSKGKKDLHHLQDTLKAILAACGGRILKTDSIQIHCPCDDHNDEKESCFVSLKNGKILCHCMVCDRAGSHKAYQALKDKKLIPSADRSFQVAEDLWLNKSVPASSYAHWYFRVGRTLEIAEFPETIRETDDLTIQNSNQTFPGILLRIDGPDRNFLGVHRTYLSDEWTTKADIENPKRLLGGKSAGGHGELRKGTSRVLHIGEGLESTFAEMLNLPASCSNDTVWCALNSGNLEKLEFPENEFDEFHIFADYDVPKANKVHGVGVESAYVLAERLVAGGHSQVFVHIPKPADPSRKTDFDDVRDQVATSFVGLTPFIPSDVPTSSLDEWQADGIPYPKDYILKENGVHRIQFRKGKQGKDGGDGEDYIEYIRITHQPVYVFDSSDDVVTGDETVTLKFYKHTKRSYRTKIVARNAITSGQTVGPNVIKDTGISVLASKHAEFAEYLLQCVNALQKSTNVSNSLGWVTTPEGQLECPPFSSNVKLGPIAASNGAGVYAKSFSQAGCRERWIKGVLLPISYCEGASVIFGFSLVSLLLKH